jgi:hypothetical protein
MNLCEPPHLCRAAGELLRGNSPAKLVDHLQEKLQSDGRLKKSSLAG